MADDLEVLEHFNGNKNGRIVPMTVYHILVSDGAGSYMLVDEDTGDIVLSETYIAPELSRESVKIEFDRKVTEYRNLESTIK